MAPGLSRSAALQFWIFCLTNVSGQTPVRMQTLGTVQIPRRGFDRRKRCTSLGAMVSIWPYAALYRHYALEDGGANHPSIQCKIVAHQLRSGGYIRSACPACRVVARRIPLHKLKEVRLSSRSRGPRRDPGSPSRSSPRSGPRDSRGPPSPRLRRDSLRSPLRGERRLEARGFEPLTSSLQSWRSTN